MSATEVVANMPLHSAQGGLAWLEVYVAVRVGVRVRVRDPDPVRGLHQLLPEADDRRHEVRGNQQLHSSVP